MTWRAGLRNAVSMGTLALVGLLPVEAPASSTPEAQAVVDRYLQAIGGPAAVRAERSVRIQATLSAFGLAGRLEGWSQRPDRSASITTIGPFTLREGNDGTVAWRVDQNGKFARRDGKDLEDARASTWFENDSWLLPDQGGGAVRLVSKEADSAGTYQVLEVTPPVGRSRRLWFSDRSGLLDRGIVQQDQHTVVSRFSDYRSLAGRLRARRTVVEVQGMPMNTAHITLDSVWVNPVLDPAVFAPPDQAVADTRFLAGAGPARVPFLYSVRHVWVKASMNGLPPEDFLLDTGASITVIDSAYAAHHGFRVEGKIEVAGAGASGGASLSQLDSLVVAGEGGGGVSLTGQKVAVLSLNPYLEPFFWRPVAGILGYDFISRFVMEVDFDQGKLTLHDPERFQYAGQGSAVPMTMAGNIPVVKARIDGQYEGEFRLDVGSGSTVDLHSPFVSRHGLAGKVGRTFEVVGGGFGGTFTSTLCRMRKMEIGPYAWDDPVVVLSQASVGGLASQDYAGNIGNHILERFKCTFDYERRVVHLEPARRYPTRDRFSLTGFQLAKLGGKVKAMQVLPGSPAAEAGIHAEDEVVSIDGRPALSFDVEELRQRFEEGRPGDKVTIEIARAGKKKKVRMTLAEIL